MAQQAFLLQSSPISSKSHPRWGFLFVLSLLLNALCLLIIGKHGQLLNRGSKTQNLQSLGWSRKAAEEAEAAAQYSCSGHGYVFVDTFRRNQDGTPVCECNECHMGPDCSEIDPDCVANVDSGDPGFLEPFWIANSEAGATVVPAWYRMSYRIKDGSAAMFSPELEEQIRAIHVLVGNAVTEGKYIVLGTGSTQLINAAINSLSPTQSSNPAQVVAAVPYYSAYKGQTELFDSVDNLWTGDARAFKERTKSLNSTTFVEFVTSPNNPDAQPNEAVLKGKNVKAVYDHAYYWPHFTGISYPVDEDIMLFTISKLTGHAGSRLGWAIIKDYDLYQKMYLYIQYNTLGVSHDTQLSAVGSGLTLEGGQCSITKVTRATTLLKAIISGYEQSKGMKASKTDSKQLLFHYAYPVMRRRWESLQRIFSASDRFSLQNLQLLYCNFFKKVTDPSPAYAWVKCEREEEDCAAVLEKGGIIGRAAKEFGADKRYVRLSLLRRDDAFAVLERRLQALVSYNKTAQESM